jgi:LysM repeat protein
MSRVGSKNVLTVKRSILVIVIGLLAAGTTVISRAQETPTPESFPPPVWVSPTPDESGTITIIVAPGDSMWIIAARAGLTLPELLALNDLTEGAVIQPGDVLIIGYAPMEATGMPEVEVSPTSPLPPPTLRPTEPRPEATICLSAFEDLNRNGNHDSGEPLRAGVAFTVYNQEAVAANYITDGVSEPKCLGGLTPGEYRVTRSVVPGEVLTTAGDWALNLAANTRLNQAFGSFISATDEGVGTAAPVAQTTAGAPSVTQPPETTPAPPPENAPTFAWRIIGVAILFLGGLTLLVAVLLLLFRQVRARSPTAQDQNEDDGGHRFKKLDDLDN